MLQQQGGPNPVEYDVEYDDADERAAIELQHAADPELSGEIISPTRVITLAGEDFRVAEKVGLMPLLKFSYAANLRTDDERAYAALYEILRDVILEDEPPCGKCAGCKAAGKNPATEDCQFAEEGDWGKFQQHAVDCKADADELMDVVAQAIRIISARPTESPSASSNGRQPTSRKSTAARSTRPAAVSRRSPRGKRAT
jgi:hypothetical protein